MDKLEQAYKCAKLAEEYYERACRHSKDAVDSDIFWKPRVKKHWLRLLRLSAFYLYTSKKYGGLV